MGGNLGECFTVGGKVSSALPLEVLFCKPFFGQVFLELVEAFVVGGAMEDGVVVFIGGVQEGVIEEFFGNLVCSLRDDQELEQALVFRSMRALEEGWGEDACGNKVWAIGGKPEAQRSFCLVIGFGEDLLAQEVMGDVPEAPFFCGEVREGVVLFVWGLEGHSELFFGDAPGGAQKFL